ncbi:hypothetical protein EDD70_3009 [Hydrogenoanaerobacterium saccharovorans]|uniref:Uncharacterized protein n=1 Tax=Hydrogenoanaerobacterium saccharovorans TaxID=474960 RepID=A0A1H8EJZ7_9FIRM|nr:hypothetical protein [Hydrogenoanaerobacterium saccharovorans]RPF41883.1 hypothetical protein EDD70_3009 [Hydrogenoanaerobacterium saccharovorans]SEN19128.1 hypothetical protein SAMN05216180_3027 [Hydrogenoanaerobacterium saccharovorans]
MPFTSEFWHPQVYEMPRTVLDGSSFDFFSVFVKSAIKSSSSIALIILGVVISVGLISAVISKIVETKIAPMQAVKKRQFGRLVNSLDFERNKSELIDDKVRSMELNLLAKQVFRRKHRDLILTDKSEEMQLKQEVRNFYNFKNEEYYRMRNDEE